LGLEKKTALGACSKREKTGRKLRRSAKGGGEQVSRDTVTLENGGAKNWGEITAGMFYGTGW